MRKSYEKLRVAIDPVIFTIDNGLKVYLKEREKEPFKGKLELPGGLLLINETAENTLRRKLKEILGDNNLFFQQFYTFSEPNRDPRTRTVTIGFIALVRKEKLATLKNWYSVGSLGEVAFDHKMIIKKAKEYLKNNVNSQIVKHFMPKEFPLNSLQEVYEIIEEKKYDNRNFRKKMISSNIVKETKKMEKNVSHRPAKLFRFS